MKTFEDLRRQDAERKKQLEVPLPEKETSKPAPRIEPKREILKEEVPISRDKLEQERQAFEEELEEQILFGNNNEYNQTNSYMPYQNANKKLMKTLLLSTIIFGIIVTGGWFYTKNHFEALSGDNIDNIHRAIHFSVLEYYQENKRYPVDLHGNIDFNTLQKRGYLSIDVEEYRSNFKFDNQYNVIRTE